MIFKHFTQVDSDRKAAAGLTPEKLLRVPFFWRSQILPGIILVLGGVIVSVTLIFFIQSASTGQTTSILSVVFCLAVFALFPLGVYSLAKSIAEIDVEHAITLEVENASTTLLSKISAKQTARQPIDQVESKVIPYNPTQPALSTIKLFQRICDGARDRRIEPIYHLIQTPREESDRWFYALQTYSQVALRLGILGTFIGLMLALGGITDFMGEMDISSSAQTTIQKVLQTDATAPNAEKEADNLLQSLAGSSNFAPMFDNLQLVFSTSIAGLETALILSGFLFILRRKRQLYLQALEGAASTLVRLVRQSLIDDNLSIEFDQIKEEMRAVVASVYDQTEANKEQMNNVSGMIATQTAQIEKGMERMQAVDADLKQFLGTLETAEADFVKQLAGVFTNTNDTFIQFMNDTKGLQNDLLAESRRVYDALSTQKLSDHLQKSLEAAGNTISQTLKENFDIFSNELPRYIESSERTAKSLEDITSQSKELSAGFNGIEKEISWQVKDFSANMTSLKAHLSKQIDSLDVMREEFSLAQKSSLEHSAQMRKSFDYSTQKFASQMEGVSGKVSDISASIKGFRPLLEQFSNGNSSSMMSKSAIFVITITLLAAGLYYYQPAFRAMVDSWLK